MFVGTCDRWEQGDGRSEGRLVTTAGGHNTTLYSAELVLWSLHTMYIVYNAL